MTNKTLDAVAIGSCYIDTNLHRLASKLTIVVKDGATGALYWSDDSVQHIEAEPIDEIANTTGAGDSFNAGVMTALAKNHSLADAISYGNKVAAAKIKAKDLPIL